MARSLRILAFDLETIAAGFADPKFVPQKVTCIGWGWVGEDHVEVATCGGSAGLYEHPVLRRDMIVKFLLDYGKADIVTGHNVLRFDLPVLSADAIRLGLPPLRAKMVQDTIRLPKTLGLKRGLDNLSDMLGSLEKKMAMSWQQWEDAYATPGWPAVRERVRSDVRLQKTLREKMASLGLLMPPKLWKP